MEWQQHEAKGGLTVSGKWALAAAFLPAIGAYFAFQYC